MAVSQSMLRVYLQAYLSTRLMLTGRGRQGLLAWSGTWPVSGASVGA